MHTLFATQSFPDGTSVAFPQKQFFLAAMILVASTFGFVARGSAATTAAPSISPASGTYSTTKTVSISDATSGAVIYYTTNGTPPTVHSATYKGPFSVSTSTNVFAFAQKSGDSPSAVTKNYITVVLPTAVPVISPGGGTYNKIQSVTLTDATPGATVHYTTNGTYPTNSSATYRGPINVTTGMQIVAFATAPGHSVGASAQAKYTIIAPQPVITPQSGTYQGSATVTMSDAVPGSEIHFTNDGSTPTTSSTRYYNPIASKQYWTATNVYRAIATAPGYLPSSVAISTFIVDQPAGTLARATIGTTPTRTIPPDFLGLAVNANQADVVFGQASTGVNTPYRTLIKNLLATSSALMLIRIEGDDTQLSEIQSAIEPLKELAESVNVTYTLGVDLWYSNLPLAESEAQAWKEGIPNNRIQAFEIGNEPDVYPYDGARTRAYTYPVYFAQFQEWEKGIKASTGGTIGVIGPSMGQETNWVPDSESSLASGAMSSSMLSQHGYVGGQNQDGNSTDGAPWPLYELLQPAAATAVPQQFAGFAAAAHKSGRIFRMNEVNSFWGGIPGISNTYSSALWSIDLMFNYVNKGMDGINWNTENGVSYELCEFTAPKNGSGIAQYSLTQVNPLYYGLLVFSQMAGNGAKLLPVSTSTSANVSIWATVDNASITHVVVLNKDRDADGNVQITLPGYTKGTVRYLSGAVYSATNGVTLGGQTFDGSTDGTLRGNLVTTTLYGNNGVFTLPNMPITSGAVIDFTK